MSKYLILIHSAGNPMTEMTVEDQHEHIDKVRAFVKGKTEQGQMKSALPLEMSGAVLSGSRGSVVRSDYEVGPEPVAGFYVVETPDLNAAVALAVSDPRFQGRFPWKMEVRPVFELPGISD